MRNGLLFICLTPDYLYKYREASIAKPMTSGTVTGHEHNQSYLIPRKPLGKRTTTIYSGKRPDPDGSPKKDF